jgi:hypothetical protein
MNVNGALYWLRRESLADRIAREIRMNIRLLRPVDSPRIWVLGQKKAGTSLAANFLSQGVYGRPAAIDLPVRRWLQRWTLPHLFRRNPRLAVEVISRILREPVVKEPNLCYYARELVSALDGDCTVVYVTRRRVQHVRSFLDRILERRGDVLGVRPDLNFVWRAYLGGLKAGDAVSDQGLVSMIRRLSERFDRVDRECQEAIRALRNRCLTIRYEDILQAKETSALHDDLLAQWGSFDWQRARSTLEVQHQPRGSRVVDERLIAELLTLEART